MGAFHVYTVEGIVLKRRNAGEADRILTVFTKQLGKIRIIAKGVRKITSRRAPHVEVGNHLILTIHKGKTMDILTEVAPLHAYDGVRHELSRIGAVYYLLELIDALLPEEQPHEEVFTLLSDGLGALENVDLSRVVVLRDRFATALLKLLGYWEANKMPEMEVNDRVEQILERRLKTVRLAVQLA